MPGSVNRQRRGAGVALAVSACLSFGLERLFDHDLDASDDIRHGLADLLDRGVADFASALDGAASSRRCCILRFEPQFLGPGDRAFNSAPRDRSEISTDLSRALHD